MSISTLFACLLRHTNVHNTMLRCLAASAALSMCAPSYAGIEIVERIGEPHWIPTGFVQSTVHDIGSSGSQANANVRALLSEAFGATHDSSSASKVFIPGTAHGGPYDMEFRTAVAASGMINTDAFLASDLVLPNLELLNYVIVPTQDAPLGASNDFSLGPIISEEVFPIRASDRFHLSGSPIGQRRTDTFHSLDRLTSANDGLNYSHLPVYDLSGRHPGESVVGKWEGFRELRDAQGNGWNLIETFTVVQNPTDVVGDLNYNGELDLRDYNILKQNVEVAPGQPSGEFLRRLDLNDDQLVNAADSGYLASLYTAPEVTSLTVGETYSQDFDSLGADGAEGSALPTAWTVADEHGSLRRSDTNVSFPITSSQIRQSGQNNPIAFNVGQSEDRGLAIYRPRGGQEASAIQLLADTDRQANAVKIDFSIEAWDRIQSASANRDGGEAAFDVSVDIDTGDGTSDLSKILGGDFNELLSLGMVTTGAVLPRPEGDFLDGNNPAHRVSFAGDVLHADIPAGSRLRFRWDTTEEAAASEGWLFGIDDVKITLASAGDANLDGQFNNSDLVSVLQAGKFATDQSALWQEGDWNGDDRFDRADVVMALQNGRYGKGPLAASTEQAAELGGHLAAIGSDGSAGDDQTSIVYDAGTGELSLDAPAGVELTSINVDSAAGIFTGGAAQNLGGSFDNDTDANIFKATFGGSFGSVSFGSVAQAGLSKQFVLNDLSVVGSLAGGGDLGNVDLVYVPEPTALGLLAFGLLVVLSRFRHPHV